MKKYLALIIAIIFTLSIQPIFAADVPAGEDDNVTYEYFEDGSYMETVIEDAIPDYGAVQPLSTTTVTKSKTSYFKNASGSVMWYVRVKGTFTYGDGSSKCTSSTPSAKSNVSSWKVSSPTGSRSGNHCSATATGKLYFDGTVINSITRTVTLTCSSTGVFS